jgi:hypothetical protein
MARFAIAKDILNRTALECGLNVSGSPVTDTNETFVQLVALLDSTGQELIELHPWQGLEMPYQIITQDVDSGTYALPDDFAYMIDQTGWEYKNTRPIGGPLSAQDWTYLKGRNLVSQSIYASFRLSDNQVQIYPNDPVMGGLDINFMYISRNWVQESGTGFRRDTVQAQSDVILLDQLVVIKLLKCKYLEANGFDSTAARLEFDTMFNSRTAKDEGAPIINAGIPYRGQPYLNTICSTPDSGFGM